MLVTLLSYDMLWCKYSYDNDFKNFVNISSFKQKRTHSIPVCLSHGKNNFYTYLHILNIYLKFKKG